MGDSAQSEWHKPGQELQGHTGFGHAKLLSYFQRRLSYFHKLETQTCSRVFPDGSIVHSLISDGFFRHKASLSDTCLQQAQGTKTIASIFSISR